MCAHERGAHSVVAHLFPPPLPPGTGNVNLLTRFVVKRMDVTESPVRQQSRPWKAGSGVLVAYCMVAEEFFCLAFVSSESFIRFLEIHSQILHEDGGRGSNRKDVG